MAELEMCDGHNYNGNTKTISGSVSRLHDITHNLGNWNDELKSFRIMSGSWVFCENENFEGLQSRVFTKNDTPNNGYINCPDAGFPDNWVSSIKLVGE